MSRQSRSSQQRHTQHRRWGGLTGLAVTDEKAHASSTSPGGVTYRPTATCESSEAPRAGLRVSGASGFVGDCDEAHVQGATFCTHGAQCTLGSVWSIGECPGRHVSAQQQRSWVIWRAPSGVSQQPLPAVWARATHAHSLSLAPGVTASATPRRIHASRLIASSPYPFTLFITNTGADVSISWAVPGYQLRSRGLGVRIPPPAARRLERPRQCRAE